MMKQGIIDLLQSERGVFALLLLIMSFSMVIIKLMSIEQWIDFAKWLGTLIIASKTVTTAMETLKNKLPVAQVINPKDEK